MDLDTPLKYVKGVGPARAKILEAKGLQSVHDLLGYPPFRYEDRSNVKSVSELAPGEMATVLATVHSTHSSHLGRGKLGLFEVFFTGEADGRLTGKWFRGGYLANVFASGMRVALFGKVEWDTYTNGLVMMHPEYEIIPDGDDPEASLHTGRIVPIYEAAGNITARVLRTLVHRILESLTQPDDPMPETVLRALKLPSWFESLREIHFPSAGQDVRALNAFRSAAHWRLIFEEFFWLECGLALKRASARKVHGIAFELNESIREKIKTMLPFKPTGAQKRVLGEIARDMAAPHPMHRLLQGDVGSGKTLVAAEAAVIAVGNGYQAVLLAPTEILAAQHYYSLKHLLARLDWVPVLLTGSQTAREKQQIKKLIAAGLAHMIIGTHALLEEDVDFHRLGLVVIDEQHRFGVMQRLGIQRKGVTPDVLVMTATPIPRTLALTVYGDLDTSVIDELPPGRLPVITRHVTEDRIEQVWSFLRKQVLEGRQAYVVCPLIEESETRASKAAEKTYQHLSQTVFPDLKVGLLHGRLRPDDKEAVMDRFQKGDLQILVSTTVIEVGVDVPNATMMVIEQAESFGLAQLHQLRGRVGRGGHRSYCVLVTGRLGETAAERIRTLVDSSDGFHIAEVDLKLRGPGEFFGTRQSGMPALRMANIIRDRDILEIARAEAQSLIQTPPSPEELHRVVAYIRDHWQRRYGLVQVG